MELVDANPDEDDDDDDETIIIQANVSFPRTGTVSYRLSNKANLLNKSLQQCLESSNIKMVPLSSIASKARVFWTRRRYEEISASAGLDSQILLAGTHTLSNLEARTTSHGIIEATLKGLVIEECQKRGGEAVVTGTGVVKGRVLTRSEKPVMVRLRTRM